MTWGQTNYQKSPCHATGFMKSVCPSAHEKCLSLCMQDMGVQFPLQKTPRMHGDRQEWHKKLEDRSMDLQMEIDKIDRQLYGAPLAK
jgi:hypothetical protein